MAEHWAYVAWDGDHIGREVERAGLADDPDRLRQLSQRIEAGNEAWKGWALSHGGDVISMGGDEGNLRVPVDHLGELPQLRDRYGVAVGATVSVGVGARLSEAGKALMAAKLQGGDRITLYEPGVEDVLAQAKPETEAEKIGAAYLQKAAGDQPALNSPAAGGGMTGPSQAPPAGAASPQSAGGQEKPADSGAEFTSPGAPQSADIHDLLGSAADAQGQQDSQAQQATQQAADQQQGQGDLKDQVLKVLKVFADRKEQLEGLQQQDPELYQSLVGMLQVLIAGARQLFGSPEDSGTGGEAASGKEAESSSGKPTQKSELEKAWPTPQESEDNAAHHRVLQDMLLEGRSLAGQPQQMAARVKMVGAGGSEYLAPGEAGREVPVIPDPGVQPTMPSGRRVNPNTGKPLTSTKPLWAAHEANMPRLTRQGLYTVTESPHISVGTHGDGTAPAPGEALGADVSEAAHEVVAPIPEFRGWEQGRDPEVEHLAWGRLNIRPEHPRAGDVDPSAVHFRWLHATPGGSNYGLKLEPGTYITAHGGVDLRQHQEPENGPLVGVYRVTPEGAVPDPDTGHWISRRGGWGHTHEDPGVKAHLDRFLQDARAGLVKPMPNTGPAIYPGIQEFVPPERSLAAMRERARKAGLIKALPSRAESEENQATHNVLMDYLQEGRPLAGQPQQMAARSKMVGPTGSEYLAPGEPGHEVPVEPDPGVRPMEPARNPKTGQITTALAPSGNAFGTLAATNRAKEAREANRTMASVEDPTDPNYWLGPAHGGDETDLSTVQDDVLNGRFPLPPAADPQSAAPVFFEWRHVPPTVDYVARHLGTGEQFRMHPGLYVEALGGNQWGGRTHLGMFKVDENTGAVGVHHWSQQPPLWSAVNTGLRDALHQHLQQHVGPVVRGEAQPNEPRHYHPIRGPGGRRARYGREGKVGTEDPKAYGPNTVAAMRDRARAAGLIKREKVEIEPHEPLGKDLMPGGKGDDRPDSDFDAGQLAHGVRVEMEEHGLDTARAREVAKDHLAEKPDYYRAEKAEPRADCRHFYGRAKKCLRCGSEKTDKAALDPGKTGRHNVVLPVGSQIDAAPAGTRDVGQLKVRDQETGKTKWRSVRSGLVRDPQGEPVSSRNPGG